MSIYPSNHQAWGRNTPVGHRTFFLTTASLWCSSSAHVTCHSGTHWILCSVQWGWCGFRIIYYIQLYLDRNSLAQEMMVLGQNGWTTSLLDEGSFNLELWPFTQPVFPICFLPYGYFRHLCHTWTWWIVTNAVTISIFGTTGKPNPGSMAVGWMTNQVLFIFN